MGGPAWVCELARAVLEQLSRPSDAYVGHVGRTSRARALPDVNGVGAARDGGRRRRKDIRGKDDHMSFRHLLFAVTPALLHLGFQLFMTYAVLPP